MDKVRGVRDDLSDHILQQHKDTAHDHLNRGTQFLTKEYFPEEGRDQFIYRNKKVLLFIFYARSLLILFSRSCQKHDNYQESIKWPLSYAEEYTGHGKMIAGLDTHTALTSSSVSFISMFICQSFYIFLSRRMVT